MDVIALAAEALRPLTHKGVIVQQGWYDGSLHALHVTLWKLEDYEPGHSDDECEIEAATIQVNIWSEKDQQPLVKEIKKLMKENGFAFVVGNDQGEPDTGIFTNAMRFLILREAEREMEE